MDNQMNSYEQNAANLCCRRCKSRWVPNAQQCFACGNPYSVEIATSFGAVHVLKKPNYTSSGTLSYRFCRRCRSRLASNAQQCFACGSSNNVSAENGLLSAVNILHYTPNHGVSDCKTDENGRWQRDVSSSSSPYSEKLNEHNGDDPKPIMPELKMPHWIVILIVVVILAGIGLVIVSLARIPDTLSTDVSADSSTSQPSAKSTPGPALTLTSEPSATLTSEPTSTEPSGVLTTTPAPVLIDTLAPTDTPSLPPTDTPLPPSPPPLPLCDTPKEGCRYTIQSGDTLSVVVVKAYPEFDPDFNLSNSVCRYNDLKNCNNLQIDQEILLPERDALIDFVRDPTLAEPDN